jgi:hypothetical protein
MVGIGDGALVGSSRPTGASVGPITGASVGAVGVGIAEGASESRDPGPDKDKKSNSSENDGATEGIGSSSFKSSSILGNGFTIFLRLFDRRACDDTLSTNNASSGYVKTNLMVTFCLLSVQ